MRNQIYDLMKEKKPMFPREKVEKIKIESKTYFEIKPPMEDPIIVKVEKTVEVKPREKEEDQPSVVAGISFSSENKSDSPPVKQLNEKTQKNEFAIAKKTESPKESPKESLKPQRTVEPMVSPMSKEFAKAVAEEAILKKEEIKQDSTETETVQDVVPVAEESITEEKEDKKSIL